MYYHGCGFIHGFYQIDQRGHGGYGLQDASARMNFFKPEGAQGENRLRLFNTNKTQRGKEALMRLSLFAFRRCPVIAEELNLYIIT